MPNQNQCWLIVNWTLKNKIRQNFIRDLNIFTEEKTFKNVVCNMTAITSQPQCVNSAWRMICNVNTNLCSPKTIPCVVQRVNFTLNSIGNMIRYLSLALIYWGWEKKPPLCRWRFQIQLILLKQGKSEGFESCDRPIVRKRPIWVKIGDVLSRVTLKFDGWPWKTIGHLSFAVSSFVQHFIAIGEFKLELQSGNAQFGSNSTIFRAVWPWNLTYDLEKQ